MNDFIKNIEPEYLKFITHYLHRFMPLTVDEMSALMNYCELRHFDKKALIVNVGEIDDYLNIVVKGLVRKYIKIRNGEAILQLATEGHVIQSEISYLTRTPSVVILEAMEPTILISMRYDKMEQALEQFEQGERLGRLIINGMYVKKDEHLYNRLAKSTKERFLNYLNQNPHMLQRVPQKYLASYLNIKPETFSRLKHLLKKKS